MKSIDVLAIGEPMIEFNQTRLGEPLYLQGYGGDTSTLVIAAARSGARSAYVTRIGDDEFGRQFLKLWIEEGVDTHAVSIDPQGYTAVYFVSHGAGGHAFSYLRAGSAASRMRPEDLPLDVIRSASYVHASGISMAISATAAASVLSAFETARAAGAKISFDANLRIRLWTMEAARASIGAAVRGSDYFFLSSEDAAGLSGLLDPQAVVDWGHELGARTVFLKLGALGVITSDGSSRRHTPGHLVQCKDATGAGDCFCGATLARLAAGDSVWDAARYANAAAALATTGYGAIAMLPRPDLVYALLLSSG